MKLSLLTLPLLCAALLSVGGQAATPGNIPALPPGQTLPVPKPPAPKPPVVKPLPVQMPPAQTPPIQPPLEIAPATPLRPQTAPPLVPLPVVPPSILTPPKPVAVPPAAYRPADPLFTRQWDMTTIGMPQAWALLPEIVKKGGVSQTPPVTVAVLDTGFVNSPELAGRVVNGYDFVHDPVRSGDGDGRDTDASGVGQLAYHGEVVANIIAAAHDGRGMAGINPTARIVQVRVAGTDGLIDPQDLADGLLWAAGLAVPGVPANPNPAKVLNLSLFADFIPLTGCDARIQNAVSAVNAKGALIVVGAANDGADASGYSPAGCRNVLTVTSATQQGTRPDYANWGRSVAIAAPGGETGHGVPVSSLSGPGGERSPNGTSMAAPHVAGVASLLLSARPRLTPTQLRALLTRTATPFPGGRCDPAPARTCGSGTLNAAAAVREALASSLGK
ncbi:S8 family serine peptidase [Deinococcus marmoris]|uniref:Serine protease, subtilase family n=1 Tax=Deinococcus marmoris TaxID=249408 RepID=A0A1U7P2B4_9DEIO|nr:S8 family serine peptidase [Deinococcus marmoris]OLV19300.1 serine protease, subtilase family [Deinococcus marmoris]